MGDSGGVIDGYTVLAPLGQGGTATVHLARRRPGNDLVALKVLAEDHRGADEVQRLRREFAFARRFADPHIIVVHDHGTYWLAMRYVDGGHAARLATLGQRLSALAQIAGALDTVHRAGIVHCDVKPSNILVCKDFSSGGAVLTDFGEAHSLAEEMSRRLARDTGGLSLDPARRITHHTVDRRPPINASLPYAPPELLLGRMPSAASDQYSLACTAVELVTGEPPFRAATATALIYAHVHTAPPRMSQRADGLSHAFDTVVDRAMAKDPDLRYESCMQFVTALTATLA